MISGKNLSKSLKKPQKNTKPEKKQKIQIHLDGQDFKGFSLRMLSVVAVGLVINFITKVDGFIIFLTMVACWFLFFAYKIIKFKEEAYQQIIEDLEEKNTKLEKSNQLLQNVFQDTTGRKVSTKDKNS